MLTKQDKEKMIQKMHNVLMTQDGLAAGEVGECLYYNKDNGCRCAIGALMDKQDAKKISHIGTVVGFGKDEMKMLTKHYPNLSVGGGYDDLDFLHEIQRLHDDSTRISRWDDIPVGGKVMYKLQTSLPPVNLERFRMHWSHGIKKYCEEQELQPPVDPPH